MKCNVIQIVIFLVLTTTIFNCNKANKSTYNDQSITATDSLVVEKIPNANAKKFPEDVSMLLPTQYRKESTGYPKNLKDTTWMELYKDEKSGKWIIGKADLQISYGRDECVGEDVMIVRSKHHNAVLFFTQFEVLTENPETILENKALFPEHFISFKFKNIEYSLSPMGNVLDENRYIIPASSVREKTEQDLTDSQITDYTLGFSAGEKSFNLVKLDTIEFSTPKIVWLGDLNGDNLPDMILDLSGFYEAQHFFFFLSDPSDKEKPLKKIADLQVVNDC